MFTLSLNTHHFIAPFIALGLACSPRETKFTTQEAEPPRLVDPHPPHPDPRTRAEMQQAEIANNALLSLLKLRSAENLATLDPVIVYLTNRMCKHRSDAALDIDAFYPMYVVQDAKRVQCGRFILKNRNQICGASAKASGLCLDRLYNDYDENGEPIPTPPPR